MMHLAMGPSGKTERTRLIERFASQLRFPYLFLLTAGLFVADLLIPDAIPFADEILLGLIAVLLTPLIAALTGHTQTNVIGLSLLAAVVLFAHRENIQSIVKSRAGRRVSDHD